MASWKYTKDSNLGTVTLGSGYTSGSGTMSLTAGHGARLPSSGDFWLANDTAGTIRIFKVTARSTDTLTVTAVASEGAGDGNLSNGATLVPVISVDAVDQLKADIVAAGALVLLEQHTASASASLDFTSMSSAYDEYKIELLNLIPASNGVTLEVNFSTDGGSSYDTSAIYSWAEYRFINGAAGTGGGSGQTKIVIGNNDNIANTANYGLSGSASLSATTDTSSYKRLYGQFTMRDGSGNLQCHILTGLYASTTTINAIRFKQSSGNIASGTIRVYGVAK